LKDKITILLVITSGIFLLAILHLVLFADNEKQTSKISLQANHNYKVAQVVDGDTIRIFVDDNIATIRMLGINTPETVDPRKQPECYGKEASTENKKLLTDAFVTLDFSPKREVKDKYGRFLAYVYKGDIFVNEYLLQNGFAREYTVGKPYSEQKEFKKLAEQAKAEKIGLWGKCER
jgi:micrococcal nuclease